MGRASGGPQKTWSDGIAVVEGRTSKALRAQERARATKGTAAQLKPGLNSYSSNSAKTAAPPDTAAARPAAKNKAAHISAPQFAWGVWTFGGLLFIAGAAPWALPWLFLAFYCAVLPLRAVAFVQKRWGFFLLDFCYFVNTLVAAFLILVPGNVRLEAAAYAMADGPLAAALAAWQCAWVFGSNEHVVSVLLHLLPGLALFAHRHHTPTPAKGARGCLRWLEQVAATRSLAPPHGAAGPAQLPGGIRGAAAWLVAAPLGLYLLWQLLYFLIVQVVCRRYIQRSGNDTSYNCLARRAARADNVWNRLVRRGSTIRRCTMYGALQLAFTVVALAVFLPTYFSYPLALSMQVLKFILPLHYGSKWHARTWSASA